MLKEGNLTTPSAQSSKVIGGGHANANLSAAELRDILSQALSTVAPGASVIAIVADRTRDDNTDVLFPLVSQIMADRGLAKLDVLIAQGTHPPMSEADKRAKIGADGRNETPFVGHIFDHEWADSRQLATIGALRGDFVCQLSGGLLNTPIEVKINRLLGGRFYDTVLLFSTTMPHEVAGFSGGAKYFFPGISGPELTHLTHWLGALAGIEATIGRVETPTRHMFEAAADFVPARVISLNSVVTRHEGRLRTHALFCGDFRGAMRRAAEISRPVHIRYTGRKYMRVVALLDSHYDDLWVGGKASYRLGPVIAEGGSLIIYGPQLRTISKSHGDLIIRYGYAPLEKIRELVARSEELQKNLCVAAHLAHVSFASRRLPDGGIAPRYSITLASGVDSETCEKVNLAYMNPDTFRLSDYDSDPDTLVVPQAGRDLYLVKPLEDSVKMQG